MIAFFVPSPFANRLEEVTRNWARYKPEHFNDILQDFIQKDMSKSSNRDANEAYKL